MTESIITAMTRWHGGVDEAVAWLDSVGWTYTLEPTPETRDRQLGYQPLGEHSAIVWPIVERDDEAFFGGYGDTPTAALDAAIDSLRTSGLVDSSVVVDNPVVVMGVTLDAAVPPPVMGTDTVLPMPRVAFHPSAAAARTVEVAGEETDGVTRRFEVFTGRNPNLSSRNGTMGGRPPMVARNFVDVARIANEARAAGTSAARVLSAHYGVTVKNAKNLIAQARREGHVIAPGHGHPVTTTLRAQPAPPTPTSVNHTPVNHGPPSRVKAGRPAPEPQREMVFQCDDCGFTASSGSKRTIMRNHTRDAHGREPTLMDLAPVCP